MWRYTQCRHRVFNGKQSPATEFQKYCFLFSYSTVRYMAIARLCLSLQLRWRHWEYHHLACSDLSNIQETLPWLVRAWPSSGHLLASSNLQPHSTFSIIKLHISLPTKVVFGSGIHIKRDSTFFALNAGTGFCDLNQKISPLSVQKKYQRWCRKSKRIDWYPSIPPSFLAGQYL